MDGTCGLGAPDPYEQCEHEEPSSKQTGQRERSEQQVAEELVEERPQRAVVGEHRHERQRKNRAGDERERERCLRRL